MSVLPEVTDLVVAGSGAAGFAAAITARRAGLEVLLLEKQPELGGTTARSGTWIWIPNNRLMRDSGLVDGRDDALRYMARLVRPDSYAADHPTLGLPPDEHEMLAAYYDHAGQALDELAVAGAIDPVLRSDAPDYFAELPENKAPYGRVVVSRGRERPDQLTGRELVAAFAATAGRLGVRIETGVAVTDVFGMDGRVEGVVCGDRRIAARRGVVFATGGFAHSQDLMTRFLPVPLHATGAAPGSEGDFLRIGMRLGAQLRNMAEAWLAPIPIEPYVGDPGTFTTNIFALRGDSMILVDRDGRRVANEKLPYHELASAFLRWDPSTASYPNLRLFMVFDEHTRRLYADGKSGNPLPLDGEPAAHVVKGDDDRRAERPPLRAIGHQRAGDQCRSASRPRILRVPSADDRPIQRRGRCRSRSGLRPGLVRDRAVPQRAGARWQHAESCALPVRFAGAVLRDHPRASVARHERRSRDGPVRQGPRCLR